MKIYIDGATQGIGVYIEGECIMGMPIEKTTGNQGEYKALLLAFGLAVQNDYKNLHIYSDSQLLVRQMKGWYQVRHKDIQPLYQAAKLLEAKFLYVEYTHIPREQNTYADLASKLGNLMSGKYKTVTEVAKDIISETKRKTK